MEEGQKITKKCHVVLASTFTPRYKPGVDFINILHAAFECIAPKSVKRY
jgi:hypothetical protein